MKRIIYFTIAMLPCWIQALPGHFAAPEAEAVATAKPAQAAPPAATTNNDFFEGVNITPFGPLFSFGQAILPKNAFVNAYYMYNVSGNSENKATSITPTLAWGITNRLSLVGYFPLVRVKYPTAGVNKLDAGDIQFQSEYAWYQKYYKNALAQATVVGAITFPTANPLIGRSAYTPFLGVTASFSSPKWYAFMADGVIFPSKHHTTKYRTQFLYDWGIGRVVLRKPTFNVSFIVEFDGIYTQRAKVSDLLQPLSGSNYIFFGPSLQFIAKNFLFQLGFQTPIVRTIPSLTPLDERKFFNVEFVFAMNFSYAILF